MSKNLIEFENNFWGKNQGTVFSKFSTNDFIACDKLDQDVQEGKLDFVNISGIYFACKMEQNLVTKIEKICWPNGQISENIEDGGKGKFDILEGKNFLRGFLKFENFLNFSLREFRKVGKWGLRLFEKNDQKGLILVDENNRYFFGFHSSCTLFYDKSQNLLKISKIFESKNFQFFENFLKYTSLDLTQSFKVEMAFLNFSIYKGIIDFKQDYRVLGIQGSGALSFPHFSKQLKIKFNRKMNKYEISNIRQFDEKKIYRIVKLYASYVDDEKNNRFEFLKEFERTKG